MNTLQTIEQIIALALNGLAAIDPALAGAVALEQTFQTILTNAIRAWSANSGAPFDITKLSFKTPVS